VIILAKRPKVTVIFQIRISPELNEKLLKESDATGESKTAIAVRIMEQYFETKS